VIKTVHNGQTVFYIDRDMDAVEVASSGAGDAVVFSSPCPGRDSANEDAAALIHLADDRTVLVLADGFGGHPAGAQAAEISIRTIEDYTRNRVNGENNFRSAIVDGFEAANEAVRGLGVGAATTLAVVEIHDRKLRSYHVGDSAVVVVGQRGRIKMRSVAHSPVGYAVESGLIDEREAMNHEERHVVSNMVGSVEMRIEIGPVIDLAARDTVLMGSDGLWDNLMFDDIIERIRKGPLAAAAQRLVDDTSARMTDPPADQPSKPDDLTVIAFRLRNSAR
jgi:serine/threonine protein phosphatase PrpC